MAGKLNKFQMLGFQAWNPHISKVNHISAIYQTSPQKATNLMVNLLAWHKGKTLDTYLSKFPTKEFDTDDEYTWDVVGSTKRNIPLVEAINENGVKVYEPRDEDKGDIARSLFYMAARYHNYIDASSFQPALKLVNFSSKDKPTETINAIDTKDSPATYGNLQTLLEWNILDPVNEFEIHRNNLVYNAVQHNRNPFIDYPSWADVAFGNKTLDLNQENGVSTNDPYIVTHDSKRKYYLNDVIKPSDFKLTYYDSKGNKTELDTSSTLVKMFYIDEENNEIFIKDGYKLSKVGLFKIKFTYFKDNVIYTAYCDIEVKELNFKEKALNFYEQNKIIILISASVLILVIVIVLTLIKKNKYKKGKQNKKNSTPKRKK